MRCRKKWARAAAVLAVSIGSATRAHAADLLLDDFSGSSLNTSNWSTGTWQLGRTQLGFIPAVSSGSVHLRHDTYNPANPGGTFKGTEIYSNQNFARGSGLEFEARVRTNAMPDGLVTSFFTYNTVPGTPALADEIDFEFLTKEINASGPASDPVLATTWNNYKTDTSNFGDPNAHNSLDVPVAGLDLSQFNTIKIRWLSDRVQWYVNNVPIRTSLLAVPDLAAPIRANFWAPDPGWTDAYSAALVPTNNAGANVTQLYDIDSIAVRRIFSSVPATNVGRVFTDTFRNGNVANSDAVGAVWTQRNQGTSTVSESNASPANLAEPLKLAAAGAGFPHAQIASGVRSEFNLFQTPITIEAAGIGFSSTSQSNTVNTIGKSILRFVLASQTLAAGSESEYSVPDALALRIEGGNLIALGYKNNTANTNTEYNTNLLSQNVSGPVRHIKLTVHPSFYRLEVEHDLSNSDSTQTTSTFSGAMSLNLADWNVTGDSAMFIQGQLNNSGANENMTALVDSLAVSTVRPEWKINASGMWSGVSNWTDQPTPNYRGANARFTDAVVTAARTVTVDSPVKAGTLTFDSAFAYTLSGANAITMDTYVGGAKVEAIRGQHTIAAPVTLNRDTTIDVSAGAAIDFTSPITANSLAITKIGAGEAQLISVRSGALTISGGALRIAAGGGATHAGSVGGLSIAGSGVLDLRDSALVVRNTSPGTWNGSAYTGVTGLITAGRLLSSTATGNYTKLAIARASEIGISATVLWAGQSVSSGDTLVLYTYGGDATLDGKINIDDYIKIDAGIANGLSGWVNGDFNYDGKINIDDYTTVIDANIANQNGTFFTSPGESGVTAIPEPVSVILLPLIGLLPRRPRRS